MAAPKERSKQPSKGRNNNAKPSFKPRKVRPVLATPPDGGWGWVVVASSFFISVLVDGVCFSMGIFFNPFREYFQATNAETAWVGAALNGTYLTIGPLVSATVNRYGCRPVAMVGCVVASAALFLSTFSPSIYVLIFVYGIMTGIGFGLVYLPAIVMVGYYFERRRALATGIACCGSGIGAFAFAPLCNYLLDLYGWKGATWILSGLVLHGVVFSLFYRPLKHGREDVTDTHNIETKEQSEGLLVEANTYNISQAGKQERQEEIKDTGERNRHEELSFPRLPWRVIPFTLQKSRPHFQTAVGVPTLRKVHSHELISESTPKQHFSRRQLRKTEESPLQRLDIFYGGSLERLPEFKSSGSISIYRQKVTRMEVLPEADDDQKKEPPDSGSDVSDKRSCCRRWFVDPLYQVFDFSLLRSPTFLVYGFSCFLCMAGFFIPFLYLPTVAQGMQIEKAMAAFLISIIGIANTVGRVMVGYFSDKPWVDPLLCNNFALIIGGAATITVPWIKVYGLFAVYAMVFGTSIADWLERLTNAFGLVIMCQGLTSFIGSPIAGALSDATGNYDLSFYVGGSTLVLAGLICIPLRRIANWENSRFVPSDVSIARK
ncbi:hypothetical protein C0Q70_12541 [Pomacea canaliculata]|uniref:Major facilitator superfamily (MFS) profile domain-containing protein n=1 Tax=Pomacea canaliculata TaxID=400727 RepID=A0A2T7P1W3_POMCA|nr:hypothetical protein C0Q70_12541 [Pomacea canaliculata]